MAALAKYSVPADEYLAWRKRVTSSQQIEARLAGVRYEGLQRVNPAFLEQQAQVHAGDVVDTAQISKEAQRMSVIQDFESVEYRLEGDPKNPTLVWLPHEKRHGPDYLKIDLGVYASAGGDVAFAIYAKHNRNWLNSLGAEWRNELQLGGDTSVATSLYQPLDAAHRFFVEPKLFWKSSVEDIFHDNDRLASYRFSDALAAGRLRRELRPLGTGANRLCLRPSQGRPEHRLATVAGSGPQRRGHRRVGHV